MVGVLNPLKLIYSLISAFNVEKKQMLYKSFEWRECTESRDLRHDLKRAPAGTHCIDDSDERRVELCTVLFYGSIYLLTGSCSSKLFYLLFDTVETLVIWQAVMSTNPPYPPSSNQPPYPSQQPASQYPPPAMMNYGSAASYPPPSNQSTYPPPVETVASNPAFPPPPTYESAVGTGAKPTAPNAYGNYAYQTQPIPAAPPPPPTYSSPDVEYGASQFSAIVSFSDKSIRLGRVVLLCSVKTVLNVLDHHAGSSF